MRCPACGLDSPPDRIFCGRCGAPLGGPRPDAAGQLGPLIGRRQELALLLQRFAEAGEGHGQVVLVAGEPGIGKTHLMRTFASRLTAAGSPPIECWCSSDGPDTRLGPLVRLLHSLAAPDATGSPTLAGLEALSRRAALPAGEVVPLFAELLALPLAEPYSPFELTPEERHQQTLEALLALLMGLAEERPLAFVAEDLHWADPSTLEFFDLLVARGRDTPLLTVATFRPEFDLGHGRSAWGWRSGMTHLPLSQLSRREVEELVTTTAEGVELSMAARREIARQADGVPLFVKEITKTTVLAAVGDPSDPASAAKAGDIPATLQESLTARLDRLGSAKAVAQLAAGLGGTFTLEHLAAVSPLSEAALIPELDRLVAAGILLRGGYGWRSRYRFKHVLFQEMARRSLLTSDRRDSDLPGHGSRGE